MGLKRLNLLTNILKNINTVCSRSYDCVRMSCSHKKHLPTEGGPLRGEHCLILPLWTGRKGRPSVQNIAQIA